MQNGLSLNFLLIVGPFRLIPQKIWLSPRVFGSCVKVFSTLS